MGLSSNTRLLTITARLTQNEYESQQITNAKLRLATQSQQASDEYIRTLNQDAYVFVTYDSYGNTVNADLTANVLYQYNDNKNQYLLANSNGQALVSQIDAKNFEASGTLSEFLKKYNIEPKMEADLKTLYDDVNAYILPSGKNKWENFVYEWMYDSAHRPIYLKDPEKDDKERVKDDGGSDVLQDAYDYYLTNKGVVQLNYLNQRGSYEDLIYRLSNGEDVTRSTIDTEKVELAQRQKAFDRMSSFGAFLEFQFFDEEEREYSDSWTGYTGGADMVKELHEYRDNLAKLNSELEKRGIEITDAISYEDSTKAQWYTNLWYRMNGNSTVKSASAGNNYQVLANELTSSSTWIKDSLTQGIVTIEQASFNNSENTVPDKDNPLVMKLNGINWKAKIFSSCNDIMQKDDTAKLARAEAAYEKKTAEINAKDEKFQRQINLLNSEHTALQTEYDSVKSAMEKNISRSFKTFNG